jgi:uncharacterized protein
VKMAPMKKYLAMALAVIASLVAVIITSYRNTMPPELYQGKSLVTGQRDETRIPGFERAMVDVLKKISGDPEITQEDVHTAVAGDIRDYVKGYTDRDRMEGIPIHDEQGTRDRPFELTVTFEREKIDGLLKKLGRMAWTGRRPQTLVLLTIKNDANSYILTSDEDRGIDQRDSLLAAAWQAGIPITLPTGASLTDTDSTQTDFEKITEANGAEATLVGSIAWNSGMKGWQAKWQLTALGAAHQWGIDDVNFDDAFRNAMRGEAQILSGHGEPRIGLK